MKRFVLAGNNSAALAVLDLLLDGIPDTDDLMVITPYDAQPDWQVDLGRAAAERGVRCASPEDINSNESIEEIRAFEPDSFISVYYNQLFATELIRALSAPAINFHPSLLPLHRGVAPIIWSVASGDRVTGLTVHLVDDGIDTGDVLYRSTLPVHSDDTGFDVHMKMANLVRGTAADLIRRLLSGCELPTPRQQHGPTSYHSLRDPRLNRLDWSQSGEQIRNIVRALAFPLPGAYAQIGSDRMLIDRVSVVQGEAGVNKPAGLVETRGVAVPHVWTGDGRIALEKARVEGAPVDGEQLIARQILSNGDFLS